MPLPPQPIALKVHSMSSLTHLRRQRKERGCHWDNTRRNKVMFRGKHSLGIVLYLCSLTQFLFLLFLFLLFRHFPSFIFFLRRVSVFCVLDDSISLLCSLFLFASPMVIFFPSEIKSSNCPGSDCCRRSEIQYVQVLVLVTLCPFKVLLCGGKYFHHHFSSLEGC